MNSRRPLPELGFHHWFGLSFAMEVPVKRDDTDVRQQEEEPVYNPLYVPGKGDRPFVSKEVPGQLR